MAFRVTYKKQSIRSKQLLERLAYTFVFRFDTHQETTDVAFMAWRFFSLLHFFSSFFSLTAAAAAAVIIKEQPKRRHDETNTKRHSSPRRQRHILLFLSHDKMHCNKMSENVKSAHIYQIQYIV